MFDIGKLKELEAGFLQHYPKGFDDPEMVKVGKKHNVKKMTEMAQECFSKKALKNVPGTVDNMVRVIGRSSMISLFEKPKFKDFANCLSSDEKEFLVHGLKQLLHGNQQTGFEAMLDIMRTAKLAKWSLMTIIPAYFAPTTEVFVKPTSAKNVLKYFEIEDPVYKPMPTWEFYEKYRDMINDSKKRVSKSLSPSNAAFSGFLMMTVGK